MAACITDPSPERVALSADLCRGREQRHRSRVAPFAEDFLQRRSQGRRHPVWDFLFTYYSFSPGKLMSWTPGILEEGERDGSDEARVFEFPPLAARHAAEAGWIARLCGNILERPPRFVCHGLHEWAMVYRQGAGEVRHDGCGLRLSPGRLAEFVEGQAVCCSHYDAFRFFTPEARPLNSLAPDYDTRLEMEQGGCLHANMDLYKWSYKLWPWIGSDLVADAFEVAAAGRDLDMRASPYDLAELGFPPVRIETAEGREEYRREQQRLSEFSEPVRRRLRDAALRLQNLAGV